MWRRLFGGQSGESGRKKRSSTSVLVVGAGIGGMSSAIMLKRAGYRVELIDLDPKWRVYGAGITITGPTLRAYRHLGLVDEIAQQGAITNGTKMFRFDGTFIRELDEPPLEEGLPATGGIMRPVLHKIMAKQVRKLGVPVKLGITVDSLMQSGDDVTVQFSDGRTGKYDVVVGADGIDSKVRRLMFPDSMEPERTGQGCWRISMRRAPGVDRSEFYMGHQYPVGITACGKDAMYLWMLTPDEGRRIEGPEALDLFRGLIEPFGGTVGWVRDNMKPKNWINYRPLSAIIQPKPWVDGRVVLLGDSAHATTPHLASGAGMAVEGAVVLAEELNNMDRSLEDCLMAYQDRRYERCRYIVETSVDIGRKQVAGASPDELGQLIGGALHKLSEPF